MPQPEPVAFTLFNLDIMWYSIIISCGIILAAVIVCYRAPRHGIDSDKILNIIIVIVPAGIVGARLYYVFFNWSMYQGNLFAILNTRNGGLAIHGGLILGILAACVMCYIYKLRPFNVLDLCFPAIALAQSMGRWGNYFNSEAHGGPTNLPWGVYIDGTTYHPTFLYESIWCFLLFLLLIYVDNHRKFEGQVVLLYAMLYSLERFFVEALRTDSLMLGSFKQAQVLSLSVIVIAIVLYVVLSRHYGEKKRGN
ncbi:MAG: prolipoprotein diacylglyceryl transferase [Bacillota bacterium]|nr:prolipoprotein diacylglyceryl transferase [Bacillota bacterium]